MSGFSIGARRAFFLGWALHSRWDGEVSCEFGSELGVGMCVLPFSLSVLRYRRFQVESSRLPGCKV